MPFNLFSGDPQSQAMLALASGLLESGGPSRTPVSLGQGAARGMMQGREAFMQAQQAEQKKKFFELQMQQFEAAKAQGAQRAAALAQLSQDPRFSGMGSLLQVDPSAAIKQAYPEPKVVAPGASLVAPNRPGSPLFTAPERKPQPSFEVSDMTPQQARQFSLDRARAGGTTVNVGPTGVDYGKPPEGMAWARNPDGTVALKRGQNGFSQPIAVPIAGGPVETKAADRAKSEAEGKQQRATQADVVVQDVDRAVDLVDSSPLPITGLASLTSAVPGTPAHDLSKLLDTIKANAGFDRLQQMRASSPTGGALGQVSERENLLLQATIGNLEQSQSKKQFLHNIKRVKETYLDIIHGPGERPKTEAVRKYNPRTGRIE